MHNQDRLAEACADGVNGDDVAFLVLPVFINQSRHQKLAPVQAFVFARRDYGAYYAGEAVGKKVSLSKDVIR